MNKKIAIFFLSVCFFANAQQVTTIAGFSGCGFVDGSLATSQFTIGSICKDLQGNIYIGDSGNFVVRKIDLTTRVVTTVAGSTEGFADGSFSTAMFSRTAGLCIDSNGNLFVTDALNHRIRKIDFSTGMVSTFAGSTVGFSNGFGPFAKFNNPTGICIDSNDNLYVLEYGNNMVRKISPTRQVTTFAGSSYGYADGIGTAAKFATPQGLCVDSQNNLYVADTYNAKIRKITPDGTVTTLAGSTFGYQDGSSSESKFLDTSGIAIDNYNNLYVTEGNRIRKIDLTTNIVSTFVGLLSGAYGSTDGIGNQASLSGTSEICILPNDVIYFTETCKIKKITNILSSESFVQNPIYLYPNPNKGSFKISNFQKSNIEIYDILGQLVFSKKQIENEVETGLKRGLYFVKIINYEGTIISKKMVVE